MSTVSPVIIETIKELQALPSLSDFALAGGTNLAYKFNHRESIDIDLFCNSIIGIKGFEKIEQEVISFYGKELISGLDYPLKENNQFTFLRFWIQKPGGLIKIELIQNMATLHKIEEIDGIKLVDLNDIGTFKLMSASSRGAKKDVYDLDFITDAVSLIDLFEELKEKRKLFNKPEHRNIFDLDGDECPTTNPLLLLNFDKKIAIKRTKPIHSHDNIIISEHAKSWRMASSSYRIKVRKLFRHLGIEYPL
ncbi:MAG TPA: nucleotidyl transferase AbiEii/AbiGii toxin family protein [Lutibacter sp.]